MKHTTLVLVAVAISCASMAAAINEACFTKSRPHKLFNTKFTNLNSTFQIDEVMLSAPFNTQSGKHVLFKGVKVEICIAGKATGISAPVPTVQNACWGQLQTGQPVAVNTPFCDIAFDACADTDPACPITPEQEFCTCSALTVPVQSPDLDVTTIWKMLSVSSVDGCETEANDATLTAKGKTVLLSIAIDATVKEAPANVDTILG